MMRLGDALHPGNADLIGGNDPFNMTGGVRLPFYAHKNTVSFLRRSRASSIKSVVEQGGGMPIVEPPGGGDRNFFAARREHEKQAAIHAKVCPEHNATPPSISPPARFCK